MSASSFDEALHILPATSVAYQVIYQDDILLVVDKPAGLLTVPGRHPANHDCLISRVQREFLTAAVVHRLDYDTSGIVILPLTRKALSDISKQFQARTVKKTYTAVVDGVMLQPEGRIDLPIAADQDNRPRYKICQQQGKPSVTEFRVLQVDAESAQSRVELYPVTGRSHQLRLHLQAIGHPILGDTLYAPQSVQQRSARLLLHATEISFRHPLNAKQLILRTDPAF
ncbi:RluA family pseudouridine synthase [Chromatiaceae bacterium AAb-1]|nr:RluA family pseudouridine synthase [Chromatiaceae bacterium AAb-1]